MSKNSPELPNQEILRLIADIKAAETAGLAPDAVIPSAPTELPEAVYEPVKNRPNTNRISDISNKIGFMVIGGAIFAAGTYAEEINSSFANQSTASSGDKISESIPAITESPSSSPSPSPAVSSSSSASPIPSPTSIKIVPTSKPSSKPIVPIFSQAKFGQMKQYTVIEKDFNLIAKDVSRISREYHKPLTLARFNGIKDARSVQAGDKLAYLDCPTNGVMVNVGDTVSQIAEKYDTSTSKLHELNGGAARAVAGWCIRLKLVQTESYPTNPIRE